MKPEVALLELTVINAEAQQAESFAAAAKALLDRGLPPEVVTRMQDLWDKTKVIGGEVVAVGKIIIKNKVVSISSVFNVACADHQIKIPRLMFTKIAETIQVKVQGNLNPLK